MIPPGLWGWVAAPVFSALVGVLAWSAGHESADRSWSVRWAKRDTADAQARESAEAAARKAEKAEREKLDGVNREGEKRIEEVRGHAAGVSADNDRLRKQVDKLLAADRARSSCTAATGGSAPDSAGNLLAVVLEKSVERNRELAAFADLALTAAQTCWAAGTQR